MRDSYDWKNHKRILNSALVKLSVPDLWKDDVRQAASIEIYETRDEDDGFRVIAGRRKAVDEMRRIYGRDKGGALKYNAIQNQRSLVIFNSFGEEAENSEALYFEDVNFDLVEQSLCDFFPEDFPEEYLAIAKGLVEGRLRQDIAKDLGVTPGRISQMLGKMRRLLIAERIYWCENMKPYGTTGSK